MLIGARDRGCTGAEADLGDRLQGHRPAAGGGHGQVLQGRDITPAVLGQSDDNWDLTIGQREFGTVLGDVTQRRDADRLAERGSRHAQGRSKIEAGLDHDLRSDQVALDARRSEFRYRLHLGRDFLRGFLEQDRVVTAQVQSDIPTATAAGFGPAAVLCDEVHPCVGDLRKLRSKRAFDLGAGALPILDEANVEEARADEHTLEHLIDLGVALDDVCGTLHNALGLSERGTRSQADADARIMDIAGRLEGKRQRLKHQYRGAQSDK